MFKLITSLFKNNSTNIINSGISALDKIILTKEEKADYLKKIAESNTDFVSKQLGACTISSKARRIIAVAVISIWAIYLIAYLVVICLDKKELADGISNVLKDNIDNATLAVIVFYFGNYILTRSGILQAFKKNKK